MLETIIIILVVLWLLGFMTSTAGSLIHLLLVVALIVLVIRIVSGRKVV
jgi:Na+/melibiose symporter-like transporter